MQVLWHRRDKQPFNLNVSNCLLHSILSGGKLVSSHPGSEHHRYPTWVSLGVTVQLFKCLCPARCFLSHISFCGSCSQFTWTCEAQRKWSDIQGLSWTCRATKGKGLTDFSFPPSITTEVLPWELPFHSWLLSVYFAFSADTALPGECHWPHFYLDMNLKLARTS